MIVSLTSMQSAVFSNECRFRALAAGRRSGKTFLAGPELVRGAWGTGRVAWYVAPTYKQAKRIAWKPLKELTRPFWASRPNETDLRIELITGGTIALRGADYYDSLRGEGLDFLVMDEFASMAPEAWTEVLRPALSDRLGGALFIGTPKGRNHFYDLFQAAGEQPGWAAFQYTTEQGGLVSAQELEDAQRELDPRTYQQEYLASFQIQTVGIVYYAFERSRNVRPLQYDPKLSLLWSLDFNVNPLCSVLAQIHNGCVHILDELILPDSFTLAACEEFLSRTEKWTKAPSVSDPPPDASQEAYEEMMRQLQPKILNVCIYGDATAEHRKTSASRTDYQILRDFFGRYSDRYHARQNVPEANPPVKDRINCVNAMLRNQAGQHRLFIDPRCKQLIKDFERVCWKVDPNGNALADLDKSDRDRAHASDAVGYLVVREFPMKRKAGWQAGPSLL